VSAGDAVNDPGAAWRLLREQSRAIVNVDPISAVGFARGAEVYERVRPEYPPEAVEWAVERLGLRPGAHVLDLAAGTGKLTRALVARGLSTLAVDPSPEMLAHLRAALPGVDARRGTAEAIPLADAAVDAVTVAQAFHWFEPQVALREIHRVLRPAGGLALVWNSRELDDPVQAAWGEVVHGAKGSVLRRETLDEREEIARSGLFGTLEEHERRWTQDLTVNEFVDLVGSRSYVARLDEPERKRVLARVRALGERLGEPIPFRYVTQVQVARRLAGP
jgi:SAM-dependent methyltransferase